MNAKRIYIAEKETCLRIKPHNIITLGVESLHVRKRHELCQQYTVDLKLQSGRLFQKAYKLASQQ